MYELADFMPDEETQSEYRFYDSEEALRAGCVNLAGMGIETRKEEDDD